MGSLEKGARQSSSYNTLWCRKPETRANGQGNVRLYENPGCVLAHTVFTAEFIDAATGIDDLLLTGIERMTGRADLDSQVITKRAAGGEFVATTTGHLGFTVIRMDVGFHCRSSLRHKRWKKGA